MRRPDGALLGYSHPGTPGASRNTPSPCTLIVAPLSWRDRQNRGFQLPFDVPVETRIRKLT
jgi:hypothetical protein